MKTREATLKDMRRSLRPGTPAFLFQRDHGGWDWSSEGSPNGEQIQATLSRGSSIGTFMTSRGQAVGSFHNVQHVTA